MARTNAPRSLSRSPGGSALWGLVVLGARPRCGARPGGIERRLRLGPQFGRAVLHWIRPGWRVPRRARTVRWRTRRITDAFSLPHGGLEGRSMGLPDLIAFDPEAGGTRELVALGEVLDDPSGDFIPSEGGIPLWYRLWASCGEDVGQKASYTHGGSARSLGNRWPRGPQHGILTGPHPYSAGASLF